MELPKHMAYPRTGNRLYCATTLPNAEGHFQVLATPSVHLLVIAAALPEVFPVDSKQSPCHRRTVGGANVHMTVLAFGSLPFPFMLWHIDPVKMPVPREASDLEGIVSVGGVVEILCVNYVNDRHHNARSGLVDAI